MSGKRNEVLSKKHKIFVQSGKIIRLPSAGKIIESHKSKNDPIKINFFQNTVGGKDKIVLC